MVQCQADEEQGSDCLILAQASWAMRHHNASMPASAPLSASDGVTWGPGLDLSDMYDWCCCVSPSANDRLQQE